MAEFLDSLFSIFFIETLMNGSIIRWYTRIIVSWFEFIFGVIDVVWICYAEIIMVGMYLNILFKQ